MVENFPGNTSELQIIGHKNFLWATSKFVKIFSVEICLYTVCIQYLMEGREDILLSLLSNDLFSRVCSSHIEIKPRLEPAQMRERESVCVCQKGKIDLTVQD